MKNGLYNIDEIVEILTDENPRLEFKYNKLIIRMECILDGKFIPVLVDLINHSTFPITNKICHDMIIKNDYIFSKMMYESKIFVGEIYDVRKDIIKIREGQINEDLYTIDEVVDILMDKDRTAIFRRKDASFDLEMGEHRDEYVGIYVYNYQNTACRLIPLTDTRYRDVLKSTEKQYFRAYRDSAPLLRSEKIYDIRPTIRTLRGNFTIAFNDFVKRQTENSQYTHYDGTLEQLLVMINAHFDTGHMGYRDGVWVIPLPPSSFYSPMCKLDADSKLQTKFISRRDGEDPVQITTVLNGKKSKAKFVDAILYRCDILDENNERTTDATWEVISINGKLSEDEPMAPITMARNFLHEQGGTKAEFTAEQFAKSIWYWKDYAMYEPNTQVKTIKLDNADRLDSQISDEEILMRWLRIAMPDTKDILKELSHEDICKLIESIRSATFPETPYKHYKYDFSIEDCPHKHIASMPKLYALTPYETNKLNIMKRIESKLPTDVRLIINKLAEHKFDAYVVGGCVRDCILEVEPKDWDITTNATPIEIMHVFESYTILPIGLQHGTVTVLIDQIGYEITTFRIDGTYTDNRRPDDVEFTTDINKDLSRRDFTMNAIAYSSDKGLVDPFNGVHAIRQKMIIAVGDPVERFNEDGLRILRAFRFAAKLKFNIGSATLEGIVECKDNLKNISKERIREEFSKILTSSVDVLRHMYERDILKYIIPLFNMDNEILQNNPYHNLTLFGHTFKSIEVTPEKLHMRLTMLLHDIGKTKTKTTDEFGVSHFYNHPEVSAEMAYDILKDLKYDNVIIDKVVKLIEYHDRDIYTAKAMKKVLNKLGTDLVRDLIVIKHADLLAQNPDYYMERVLKLSECNKILDYIITKDEAFTVKSLNINGNQLMKLGYPKGKIIGNILKYLLDEVMDGNILNEYTQLQLFAMNTFPMINDK